MTHFANEYRRIFRVLGRPLGATDGRSKVVVEREQRRLGVRLPKSLRDYYVVAGRERRFNSAINRLLSPQEWYVTKGKIAFMVGYQGGILYGVNANRNPKDDPSVFRGFDDDPVEWKYEHRHCSAFLGWMILWQATVGRAMPFFATTAADGDAMRHLDNNWSFYREHNEVRAYCTACFLNWNGGMRLFVGAGTKSSLDDVSRELKVGWERIGRTATKTVSEWAPLAAR